jgi:hypothetical protein
MLRLTGVLVVLALAVLTMSHGTRTAQAAADKQLVCHVTGNGGADGDSLPAGPQRAHIIEVSVHAVPAHLRNHGDCLITSTDRSLIGQPCDPTDANGNDICDVQP